ncbi:DUF2637 domain-containing protein [Streptomyces lydicus]|uniref:DUF2637 domain-containing protein n=1 Tax=Streptomyces lydicus TaxID=47763 RepID=UPI0033CAF8F9
MSRSTATRSNKKSASSGRRTSTAKKQPDPRRRSSAAADSKPDQDDLDAFERDRGADAVDLLRYTAQQDADRQLASARRQAEEALGKAREQVRQLMAEAAEEVGRRLRQAAEDADDVRLDGGRQAQQMRTEATEAAEAILTPAREQARQVMAEAAEEAGRRLRQASKDADEVRATADRDAEDTRNEGRRQANRAAEAFRKRSEEQVEEILAAADRRACELVAAGRAEYDRAVADAAEIRSAAQEQGLQAQMLRRTAESEADLTRRRALLALDEELAGLREELTQAAQQKASAATDALLRSARDEADHLLEKAREEADTERAAATTEAEKTILDASRRAAGLQEEAEGNAENLIALATARAQTNAATILTDAARQAEDIVTTAHNTPVPPSADAQQPEMTRKAWLLVSLLLVVALAIAAFGFWSSYATVGDLARDKGFHGNLARFFPAALDAIISLLLVLDLFLRWRRHNVMAVRLTAWVFTGWTIALNARAQWPDPLGAGMHALAPAMTVALVEVAGVVIAREMRLAAGERHDTIPLMRLMVQPLSTVWLWRLMRTAGITSYARALDLHRARVAYRRYLITCHGRWTYMSGSLPQEARARMRAIAAGMTVAEQADLVHRVIGIDLVAPIAETDRKRTTDRSPGTDRKHTTDRSTDRSPDTDRKRTTDRSTDRSLGTDRDRSPDRPAGTDRDRPQDTDRPTNRSRARTPRTTDRSKKQPADDRDAETRAAAQQEYRASLKVGKPIGATALGRRHGRDRSWGQRQIAAVSPKKK